MSFVNYLREQEEAEEIQAQDELKAKITDAFTVGEVTDETLTAIADENEMELDDIKAIVYQMLTDLLTATDEAEEEAGEEGAEELEMEEGCKKKVDEESEEAAEDDEVEKEDEED